MYTQRKKYWPAYTWKIQTSYSSEIKDKISSEAKISKEEFREIYFYIFDKINSSFYHLERLKANENIALEIGKAMVKVKIPGTENMIGVAGVTYEPIGYEYESFLIKLKSALDFISILIAKCIDERDVDNIRSLRVRARSMNLTEDSLKAEICKLVQDDKFAELLEDFDPTTGGKKSKRNYATHKGSLTTGTINVPVNRTNVPIVGSKIFDPNDKKPHFPSISSPDLVDYCEKQFYQTCDLMIEVLSLLTQKKFTPGKKMSVYEVTNS